MIRLSNADTRRLVDLLNQAQAALREHAVEQSYRRDACKIMRERILADFHDRRWHTVCDLADQLTESGGALLQRLDAADSAA